jgi:uncharacterized membrane protein YphA (DoxX/SURF4 family)
MFPNGLVGAGLLVMRVAGALAVVVGLRVLAQPPAWAEAALIALAAAVLVGVWTRVTALVCAALAMAARIGIGGELGWVAMLIGVGFLGLAMTGPGAHSVDARLFGRRVIRLDRPRPHDRAD